VERYTALGVEVLQGRARIVDPLEVEVARRRRPRALSARSIVIATGARPRAALPGLEAVGYLTSTRLGRLRVLPRRLLVLGGGPIGCELAQASRASARR
jgi:pyruvate/2-oxoglutarate dehydrogenase complex dihydrolipoamide dehydrogenase (E3) component